MNAAAGPPTQEVRPEPRPDDARRALARLAAARRVAWIVYAAGALLMLADPLFAAAGGVLRWFSFAGAGLTFLALPVLIGLYWRVVAQWRTLIVLALAAVALEWLQVRLGAAGGSGLAAAAGVLVAALRLEGLLTFFAAMVMLAIRRDVSVAYLVLSFGFGMWLVYAMIRSAGGVLAFFTGPLSGGATAGLNLLAPLVANTACMATLGLLTFIPHFVWLVIKEMGRR